MGGSNTAQPSYISDSSSHVDTPGDNDSIFSDTNDDNIIINNLNHTDNNNSVKNQCNMNVNSNTNSKMMESIENRDVSGNSDSSKIWNNILQSLTAFATRFSKTSNTRKPS